tara:strand:- start:727 stop:942 length:216 start_codon:yes stop_codon:yes gene_type:complete
MGEDSKKPRRKRKGELIYKTRAIGPTTTTGIVMDNDVKDLPEWFNKIDKTKPIVINTGGKVNFIKFTKTKN